MRFPNITILAILLLILISCEKILEFSPDDFPPEITLNAIVGKDSTFKISVEKSISTLSFTEYREGQRENTDFQVDLFGNNEFIEQLKPYDYRYFTNGYTNGIPDSTTERYYVSEHRAQSGVEYQLKVEHADFEQAAFATASLPDRIPINKIDTSVYVNPTTQQKEYIRFQLSFDDPADEMNYYQLVVTTKLGIALPPTHEIYDSSLHQILLFENRELYVSIESSFINPEEDADEFIFGSPYNRFRVFNDNKFNGSTCTIEAQSKSYSDYFDVTNLVTEKGEFYQVNFSLLQISKEAYLYYTTVDEQLYNNDNPFVEPNIAYSNIENGVGIFAGYAADTKQIQTGIFPSDENTYINGDYIHRWFRTY